MDEAELHPMQETRSGQDEVEEQDNRRVFIHRQPSTAGRQLKVSRGEWAEMASGEKWPVQWGEMDHPSDLKT